MAFRLVITIKQRVCLSFHSLQKRFLCWVKLPTTSLVLGTLLDLTRGKSELLAENALLRHQLTILRRQIKRPVYRKSDRLLLVLLASMVRTWKQALFLVQPETLLRWHRELFRLVWKHKSTAHSRKPRLSPETISLIKEMAANNRLWGAERIRGELLKLDIRVSKRTIQKYMKQILQSGSAASRDRAADSRPTAALGSATKSAKPSDLHSRVGWIASHLPKSSINLGKRVYRGQAKPMRWKRMVVSIRGGICVSCPVFIHG